MSARIDFVHYVRCCRVVLRIEPQGYARCHYGDDHGYCGRFWAALSGKVYWSNGFSGWIAR